MGGMGGISLFSRANPRATPQKKVHGFMRLPGELRNKIYGYYFEEPLRVEIAAKGAELVKKKRKTIKLCFGGYKSASTEVKPSDQPRTLRMPRKLGNYKRVDGLQTQWESSLSALPFVSKQIYVEVLEFLYNSTTFVFAAPKRIFNFLEVVPKVNLSYITKVSLHYTTYGEPLLIEDRQWMYKHRVSWSDGCRAITKKLTNLRALELTVNWPDENVFLDLRQPFLTPLWQFRRLFSPGRAIMDNRGGVIATRTVKVIFNTHWSEDVYADPAVAKASEELHAAFALAIERAICGWNSDDAMTELHKTWDEHEEWHFFLSFMATGW